MNTQNNDRNIIEFKEHQDHIGYAYARYEDDDNWHGAFETKQDAIANLLSEDWDGCGWISAARAVSEYDEDADEDWAFICYGPKQEVINKITIDTGTR